MLNKINCTRLYHCTIQHIQYQIIPLYYTTYTVPDYTTILYNIYSTRLYHCTIQHIKYQIISLCGNRLLQNNFSNHIYPGTVQLHFANYLGHQHCFDLVCYVNWTITIYRIDLAKTQGNNLSYVNPKIAVNCYVSIKP